MAGKTCPRCLETLVIARGPGVELDVCRACGGVLFDHGELAKLTIKLEDQLDEVERLVEPEEPSLAGTDSRGLQCPSCPSMMEIYEYSFCSGITLDRCPECFAIWVDDGELQAIQDHRAKGDTKPSEPAPLNLDEDARVLMAAMDCKVQQAQSCAKAIRSFSGVIRSVRYGGIFWW